MPLILKDFFSFAPSAGRTGGSSSNPNIREAAKSGRGLKVTFAASHAGMVNGNNVMYSPVGMKDCSYTWVWPQRRPIQIHHDDHADPIGRVIGARYSAYGESDITESQSDALNIFRDNLKLTKDNVVDIAKTLEDSKVLNQADWRGVGELILDGVVTDSDAIEKILDERYLGVSITQRPKKAFCSICGQDWVKDGSCEHERGEKDEESGRTMYLIVDDTEYVELSYVNAPADNYAMGIAAQSINEDPSMLDSSDKKDTNSSILDRSMLTTVSFQLVDSLDKEIGMTLKNENETNDGVATANEQDAQSSEPEVDSKLEQEGKSDINTKESSDSVEQDSNDSDKKDTPLDDDPANSTESNDHQVTIEEALQCLFEDRDNLTGFMCDVLFDAQEELVEEDAKLSTKKRKSLPGSSFCGPNRSFPVNDCAHYTAAKRLIGRYQGPGDKSAIMSCIERKGKSMGCSGAKKSDERDSFNSINTEDLTNLPDELICDMLLTIEKDMVRRGLKAERKCEKCDELTAQIAELNDSVPQLQDTANILREEYKTVVSEHIASEDAHTKTLNEYHSLLQSSVLNFFILTDKDTSIEELSTKVEGMSFEDLKKEAEKINFSEIISFIRSGLTQNPDEIITQDDAEPIEQNQVDPAIKLSKSLVNFYKAHGQVFAQKAMSDWVRAGKLPEGFTLDKAFELVAK